MHQIFHQRIILTSLSKHGILTFSIDRMLRDTVYTQTLNCQSELVRKIQGIFKSSGTTEIGVVETAGVVVLGCSTTVCRVR